MSRRVAPTLAFKLGIGMAIGALVVGIGALAVVGWVLPVVPLTGLGLLGATLSASRAYLDNERQRSALARDLALGETVQSMLLPQARSGQIGPWRYRLMFRPLGPMSGDWFQVFEGRRPDGEPLGVIAVGDVIGKGPSAALTTAAIAAVWSEHKERWAARDLDTSEFCQLLHRVLCGLFSGRQNTSLSLAVLEPEGVTYAAVAAPSWIEIAPRQAVCELLQLAGSDPIGMQDEPVAVETASWNGRDGELLVAATDGIFADRGSLKRLRELSLSLGARLEPKALDEVLAKLASEARHPDDATALVITRA